jgi:hypothetical protein
MESIGLLIQRRDPGFKDIYISDNLKEIRKTTEIEKTAKDEGTISTPLSNQSDVYTVQITTNYKVYSFINTNITDNFGRAAFYAIRLYVPKKYPSTPFEAILEQINNKYLEYERSGISQNNQSYDEILQNYVPLEVTQQDYIFAPSNEDAFCLINPADTQLSILFNDKSIALYNKVYAFNKERAVNPEIMKTLGLKSVEETKNNKREVFIDNNDRALKDLKINDVPIDFTSNETNYTLLCKINDTVVYNTKDNLDFKPIIGTHHKINKREWHREQPQTQIKVKKKTFLQENGIYLGILLLTIILASGAWWMVEGESWWKNYNKEPETPQTERPIPTETINEIVFDTVSSSKDSTVFKTNYSKIEKYRFKIENKKWTYKNTRSKNEYADFYRNNLDVIIKKDSLEMNEKKKTEFLEALGKIGGEIILGKAVKEKTATEIKKPEAAIKKAASKPIKNKGIPASNNAKPKDELQSGAALPG